MHKPFSESCEQNRAPILDVLSDYLADVESLLEIGSGTGQHAVYFAAEFPLLRWQTSDRAENHAGIQQWLEDARLENIDPPLALDVARDAWPETRFGAVFSANTTHIMGRAEVEALFAGVGRVLASGGVFVLYGPFNYAGDYSSDSNRRFDQWLKARDPASGIKDFEWLNDLAGKVGMSLLADHAMPANNRILVWRGVTPDVAFR